MQITSFIDHTLLKVDATTEQIRQLCDEAVSHCFASVCVPPFYVKQIAQELSNIETDVKTCTVIGFPMGYSSTPSKIEEIKRALEDGADEVDAVINICAVKNQQWNYVHNEIDSLSTLVRLKGKKIKIILETGLLNLKEIERLTDILLEIKPNFAKTSTGLNGVGAELEKVLFLHKLLQNEIAIKASGGIRDFETAKAFIEAGAQRIGTSSGIAIAAAAPR